MPHLNELDEKYRGQGLTVLALTSEGAAQTEKWIEAKGAHFAYGYDRGGLAKALGVRGIPASFLVGPDGKVVWQGHPSGVNDALIEKHLEGVISLPLYEWEGDALKIKKAFLEGKFDKAFEAAAKLAETDPFGNEAAAIVRRILDGRLQALERALEQGDILTAYTGAKDLGKQLKGMPEADRMAEIVKLIGKDKQMKGWMKAQEKLLKLTAETPRRKKECDELLDDLRKLMKGNEDSFVGSQIAEKIAETANLRGRLQF